MTVGQKGGVNADPPTVTAGTHVSNRVHSSAAETDE